MHRHEADINAWLPPAVAPRLRWRVEANGWLVLGFDRADGRHADLTPGSPDLAPVIATVSALTTVLAHFPGHAPSLAEQWERLAPWRRLAKDTPADLDTWARAHLDQLVAWEARAVEAVNGDSLVHTDLHALNILVSGRQALVLDWAWSRVGASVADVAFLVARLIAAGHSPSAAERWAAAVPIWPDTPEADRSALAVAIWGIWEYQSRTQPRPLWTDLVPAARRWALHRIGVAH